ncbi:MAG: IS1595 family transposase [Candidatus Scalindua sp.]|nr:IS1595 family transposase [Candidatus Scalindua sp.]
MIYLLSQTKNSYSVLGLQKLLQIKSYKTAWLMAHKIRKAMADRDASYKLGSLIEMDDAYFGKSRATGKRGRGASKKSCVIVSVNVNERAKPVFAIMNVVSGVDSKNVSSVVQKNIHPDSQIKTDGWPSYHAIKKQNLKHDRRTLGNPKNASKVLPWVHILIANCKSVLRGTHHGISLKYLHRYLSEFCYRFNRRFWQNQLFDRLMYDCLSSNTITFSE